MQLAQSVNVLFDDADGIPQSIHLQGMSTVHEAHVLQQHLFQKLVYFVLEGIVSLCFQILLLLFLLWFWGRGCLQSVITALNVLCPENEWNSRDSRLYNSRSIVSHGSGLSPSPFPDHGTHLEKLVQPAGHSVAVDSKFTVSVNNAWYAFPFVRNNTSRADLN